ncbi:MAG: RNA polymerase sigma factor [Elusimicrobiota bacterium]|nr:RNA polymerase sigma factor [Elusimicrobiota bacterium]
MKKKTCANVGEDGKGNSRALNVNLLNEVLKGCLEGKKSRAWQCAYNLCRDTQEAHELVQEACYRALKSGKRHEASGEAEAWLYVTLRNVFLDSRRRAEWRKGRSLDCRNEDGDLPLHETLAKPEEAFIEGLLRQERAGVVRAAMKKLGKNQRRALALCDMEGMSYKAAAKAQGVPMGTFRSRLFRARRTVVRDAEIRRLA